MRFGHVGLGLRYVDKITHVIFHVVTREALHFLITNLKTHVKVRILLTSTETLTFNRKKIT